MKTRTLLAAMATTALLAATADVSASTITGTTGGANSWNDASNWDAGVPSGTDSATIADGVLAQTNATTSTYSGGLTVGVGSTLRINDTSNSDNDASKLGVLGSGTITLKQGATIDTATQTDPTFTAIQLDGDGFFISSSSRADRDNRNFGGVISGSGDLTVTGRNVEIWSFDTSNTYSGDTTFNASDRYVVRANAANSFGVGGTLTVNQRGDTRSAVLDINAVNGINPNTDVVITGNGGNNSNGFDAFSGTTIVLNLDANQTLSSLTVNGSSITAGTYTSSDFTWLGGNGTLTIVPEPSSLALLGLGGLLIARRRRG